MALGGGAADGVTCVKEDELAATEPNVKAGACANCESPRTPSTRPWDARGVMGRTVTGWRGIMLFN